MKVSLRKANALQVAINEAIKGLNFNYTVGLNEFQDTIAAIAAAATTFSTSVGRRTALLDALYEIRKSVDVVNSSYDINSTLANIARLEKDIQFYGSYAKAEVRAEQAVIDGKLAKIRTRAEDAFGYRRGGEVQTSVLTTEDVKNYRSIVAECKKQKQKLQDELLESNVRNVIHLTDKTVAVLQAENII
jgi:hypothetical protein